MGKIVGLHLNRQTLSIVGFNSSRSEQHTCVFGQFGDTSSFEMMKKLYILHKSTSLRRLVNFTWLQMKRFIRERHIESTTRHNMIWWTSTLSGSMTTSSNLKSSRVQWCFSIKQKHFIKHMSLLKKAPEWKLYYRYKSDVFMFRNKNSFTCFSIIFICIYYIEFLFQNISTVTNDKDGFFFIIYSKCMIYVIK